MQWTGGPWDWKSNTKAPNEANLQSVLFVGFQCQHLQLLIHVCCCQSNCESLKIKEEALLHVRSHHPEKMLTSKIGEIEVVLDLPYWGLILLHELAKLSVTTKDPQVPLPMDPRDAFHTWLPTPRYQNCKHLIPWLLCMYRASLEPCSQESDRLSKWFSSACGDPSRVWVRSLPDRLWNLHPATHCSTWCLGAKCSSNNPCASILELHPPFQEWTAAFVTRVLKVHPTKNLYEILTTQYCCCVKV